MRYRLQWSDDREASDPRITTENGVHTYEFETGSREDAEAVVQTFMAIEPEHNFTNHTLTEETE